MPQYCGNLGSIDHYQWNFGDGKNSTRCLLLMDLHVVGKEAKNT